MKICQGCGQPIGQAAHASAPAPSGGVWYLHLWPADCVRALIAAQGKRKAAA